MFTEILKPQSKFAQLYKEIVIFYQKKIYMLNVYMLTNRVLDMVFFESTCMYFFEVVIFKIVMNKRKTIYTNYTLHVTLCGLDFIQTLAVKPSKYVL